MCMRKQTLLSIGAECLLQGYMSLLADLPSASNFRDTSEGVLTAAVSSNGWGRKAAPMNLLSPQGKGSLAVNGT